MNGILERYAKQLDERTERQQRFALGDDGYRLYQAAPDLLEVLEDIMRFQVKNDCLHLPVWTRAREAIAKAKGGD
jgi:benzoyl-CoA reductase/2-hydroxyglutaryl-CoA dehydratase subunit BcrC/BadD/HgdB